MNKDRVVRRHAVVLAAMGFLVLSAFIGLPTKEQQPQDPDLKPPSELALLMRHMTSWTDSTKQRLGKKGELPPFPKEFAKILTAMPTDGKLDIERSHFDAFAHYYLDQLKGLYAATPEDRPRIFNATVNGCATCHGSACPGPLVKIRKLYVPL
ncbi:MAG: hypothetical protein H6595_12535 [Flavobacteriales bacterium]|nr:hypothetical protein [Flavobacteriales bacterium]MCB9168289.1 hypothetical protein [Flavobacteriales bacterium]